MRLLVTWFVFLSFLGLSASISVQEADLQGNEGREEEEPIEVGNSAFRLGCDLRLDDDADWVLCMWKHELAEKYDDDDNPLELACNAKSSRDNAVCENTGGSHDIDSDYYSRIRMDVRDNYCGLIVNDPVPEDDGTWTCHVGDRKSAPTRGAVDVHVANQSTIVISEPDLEEDSRQTITYDLLNDGRPQIQAKCRAYGGKPEPEFHWFLDEDNNELDHDSLKPRQSSGNGERGRYMEESITFAPSVDDLCNKYDLDVCRDGGDGDGGDHGRTHSRNADRRFTFNLICKVTQDGYFEQENDEQRAEVTVEVNGTVKISTSFVIVAIMALTSLAAQL